jgi:hypothetical protein
VFELLDPDLVIELVVKRKSSAVNAGPKNNATPPAVAAATSAPTSSSKSSPAVAKSAPAQNSQSDWDSRMAQLVAFKRKHGHINVSPADDPELSIWVAQHAMQISKFSKPKATPKRKQKVRTITKARPRPQNETRWNHRMELLREYRRQYGNCLVPQSYTVESDGEVVRLGDWVLLQVSDALVMLFCLLQCCRSKSYQNIVYFLFSLLLYRDQPSEKVKCYQNEYRNSTA